jgi:hypothetical protein
MFQTIAGPRSRPPADRLGGEVAAQPRNVRTIRTMPMPGSAAAPRRRYQALGRFCQCSRQFALSPKFGLRYEASSGRGRLECGVWRAIRRRLRNDQQGLLLALAKALPGRRRPRSAARQDPALRLTWRVPVIRFAWAPSWSDREASQSVRAEGEGRCHET